MQESSIGWTDITWNPLRGCSRTSPGCGGPRGVGGCYAEKIAGRFSGPGLPYEGLARRTKQGWRWTGKVRLIEDKVYEPLSWRDPRRIFVNSMSDLFHDAVSDTTIALIFSVMAKAHWHTFQVLTKRAARMKAWFETREACAAREVAKDMGVPWPLPNVWLGVSVEEQAFMYRVTELLGTPAELHFISAEPLLGPLDLTRAPCPQDHSEPGSGCELCGGDGYIDALQEGLDWVIAGSESGVGARPMQDDWVRTLRDQCDRASVPFFFKQRREGKRTISLPVLDGRQYDEYPVIMSQA